MRSTPIPVTRTLGQEQEGLLRAQLERTNQRPVSGSGDHSGLIGGLPGRVDGTLGQRCWLLVIGLLQVRPLLPPLAAHDQGGLGEVTGYSIITPDMELPW